MIIGHNPQYSGIPTIYCDNKLYLNDVGLSHAYGGNLAATQINLKTNIATIIK